MYRHIHGCTDIDTQIEYLLTHTQIYRNICTDRDMYRHIHGYTEIDIQIVICIDTYTGVQKEIYRYTDIQIEINIDTNTNTQKYT